MAGAIEANPDRRPGWIRGAAQPVVFAVLLHAYRVFAWGIHWAWKRY